ncbi:MAG: DUF6716 putative glycosyltransferase [Thermoleophilia bacterium]
MIGIHFRIRGAARTVLGIAGGWMASMEVMPSSDPTALRALFDDYLEFAVSVSLWAATMAVRMHTPLFSAKRAKALVLWNDVLPQHRALVDSARAAGLPTILYQHGMFALKTLHDRPRTDRVAVWGPSGREWLKDVGFPEDRVDEVGLPTLRKRGRSGPADDRRPRVLFASQPSTGFLLAQDIAASQKALSEVARACRDSGCHLVAKAHPAEGFPEWGSEVLAICPDAELHLDLPMDALVAGCDVLVSRSSTSALDALAAGVPVIILADEKPPQPNPYDGAPGIDVVRSSDELDRLLRERVVPAGRSWGESGGGGLYEFALDWLAGPYGEGSSDRLVRAIDRVAADG